MLLRFVAAALAALALAQLAAAAGGTCSSGAFSVSDETIGSGASALGAKVLRNTKTGERASIIWESGGTVSYLYLSDPSGAVRDVLMHNEDPAKTRAADDHSAGILLAPFANRIRNGTYAFGGATHYLPRNECTDVRCGALHGFLRSQVLDVVGAWCTATSAGLTLRFAVTPETHEGYPFAMTITLAYELRSGEGFAITAEATNTMAEDPLPWTFSWHPYFLVSDVSKAVLTLDQRTAWNHVEMSAGAPRLGDLIPTGKVSQWTAWDGKTPIAGNSSAATYYDDEYKACSPPSVVGAMRTRLRDPAAPYSVLLWSDLTFRVVQLYTGLAGAVAIEPMTAMADAFNNHDQVTILSAGETFRASLGVRLEK